MKKLFPLTLMLVGIVFLGAGIYTVARGVDARTLVRDELLAQDIRTPKDASIPNVRVNSVATAQSMIDIIEVHTLAATKGKTYSEMGRFLAISGDVGGTDVATEAVADPQGKPIANPLRNVAFQGSSLRTSLYTSVMAFEIATLVIGLGVMIVVLGLAVGGVGVALGGLVIPTLGRKLHVEPLPA